MNMIRFIKGDLLAAEVEAQVNPVNCVGIMGGGLARAFSQRYPHIMPPYVQACREGTLRPGKVQGIPGDSPQDPSWIVNFPTMDLVTKPARLEWVEQGLAALLEFLDENGVRSVAIPALGAGIGGLQWEDVKRLIEAAFEGRDDMDVQVFLPHE